MIQAAYSLQVSVLVQRRRICRTYMRIMRIFKLFLHLVSVPLKCAIELMAIRALAYVR